MRERHISGWLTIANVAQSTGCGFFKTGEFVCKPLQAWIFSR